MAAHFSLFYKDYQNDLAKEFVKSQNIILIFLLLNRPGDFLSHLCLEMSSRANSVQ